MIGITHKPVMPFILRPANQPGYDHRVPEPITPWSMGSIAAMQPRNNPAFNDTWLIGATGGAARVYPQGPQAYPVGGCSGCGDDTAIAAAGGASLLGIALVGTAVVLLASFLMMDSGGDRFHNPRRPSLRTWVKSHRAEIDETAEASGGGKQRGYRYRLNDEDRMDWVLNDAMLYYLAKRDGVKI